MFLSDLRTGNLAQMRGAHSGVPASYFSGKQRSWGFSGTGVGLQGLVTPSGFQGCMTAERQFPHLHDERLRVRAQRQNVDMHSHHRCFPNFCQISLCLSFLIVEVSIARLRGCEPLVLVKSFLCERPMLVLPVPCNWLPLLSRGQHSHGQG